MQYDGIELKEITESQVFSEPKTMLVWDDNDTMCLLRPVISITAYNGVVGVLAVTDPGTYLAQYAHCAEIPEEPKPRKATKRELSKWLAQGNGEWSMKSAPGQIGANTNYGYVADENQYVDDGILVRTWDDTEWHEPDVQYMGIMKVKNVQS